ncbi:hypothetical protein MMC30_004286 [Trapelia coarctata]|nr:hypothetical protein [Trapelia coarctata]
MSDSARYVIPLRESNHPENFFPEEVKGWHGSPNGTLFPRQSNIVTLQYSGTKRIEQINDYAGDGDELISAPWGEGAIETTKWAGVSLKKVLKYCGGLAEGTKHTELMGVDTYVKKGHVFNYVVSVPWRKMKAHEVLLAWEMNGKALPKIHGDPLRAVVYGYIGARRSCTSVKWLNRVNAITLPSAALVQKKEYLYYTPQAGKHNATYSSGFSIQDMPVSSAIMAPIEKAVIVHSGSIKLNGRAYSGGGHWPERVKVSVDGGMCERSQYPAYIHQIGMELGSIRNFILSQGQGIQCQQIQSTNSQALEERRVDLLPITKPLPFNLEEDDDYDLEIQRRKGRDPEE